MSSELQAPEPAETKDSFLEPGVRYYLFLGSAGLLVIWLVLMERPEFGIFALVPVLLGALGMAAYLVPPNLGALSRALRRPLYLMPVLLLAFLIVFVVLFGDYPWRGDRGSFALGDLLLAPALLAYLAAQYRLFCLGTAAVPADARPRPDRLTGDEPDPRPARLVEPIELAWLGGIILGCVLGGQLLWRFLITEWTLASPDEPERLGVPDIPWRMLLLMWLVGVSTLVLTGMFRVLRAYRAGADEARMVLQDALWAETRGEQRRAARWLAWARRKTQRKLEKLA